MIPPSQAQSIGPDSQPVFPCWLWDAQKMSWEWCKVRHDYDLFVKSYSHWHPDQPDAPTETPCPICNNTGEFRCHTGLEPCLHDTPAPSALTADSSKHISIGAFPEMFNPMCECESCGRERKRLFDKHIGPPPSPDKSAGGTPRTDVEVFYRDSQPVVEAGFARTFERETINLTAELAAVRNVTVARLERELAQAQQSLAEARTVAQQEKEHHDFYRNKVSDYMGAEIEWQKTFNSLRTKLKESRAQLKDLTDQNMKLRSELNQALDKPKH